MLVAVARLIRTLHEASAGWAPPPDAVRGGTPANTGPITGRTELVSHRDYYPGNVVFRDGLAAALIDFDLAKPSTWLYDRCGRAECGGDWPGCPRVFQGPAEGNEICE